MRILIVAAGALLLPSLIAAQGGTINVDHVVDYSYCRTALAAADANGNRELSPTEYLTFVKLFEGRTECLGPLQTLPLELRSVFNQLSCECLSRGGAPNCCIGSNANIPTQGVLPGENSQSDNLYINQVCLRTDQAVISYCGPPPPGTGGRSYRRRGL